jgi:hypothetical protein
MSAAPPDTDPVTLPRPPPPPPPGTPNPDHPMFRRWPPFSDADPATNPAYQLPITTPLPKGTCTPNGLPWAHSRDDFFKVVLPPSAKEEDIERRDEVIWSRSMISEAWGENAFDGGGYEGEDPEPAPRVRRPWPQLGFSTRRIPYIDRKSLNAGEEERKVGLGVIDEGSDHDGEFEMRPNDDAVWYDDENDVDLEMLRKSLERIERQGTILRSCAVRVVVDPASGEPCVVYDGECIFFGMLGH